MMSTSFNKEKKMKNTLVKFVSIFMLVAVLAVALPLQTAFAAGLNDDAQPPAEGQRGMRLVERKFKLEQRRFEAQGKLLDRSDDLLERAQNAIDRAAENDLDTSAAQAALEDFEQAIGQVASLYEQAGEILESHAGFDDDGKVTDIQIAAETVEQVHLLLDQARDDIQDEREALQHALWDLFQESLKK
jgi:hypothetical protein